MSASATGAQPPPTTTPTFDDVLADTPMAALTTKSADDKTADDAANVDENGEQTLPLAAPKKKKRKLSDGAELDQYDCKFGIRIDSDGDVVLMTDESEISSLNDEDTSAIRERFEETRVRLDALSAQVVRERERQVRELEASLCAEEARLSMLKKTRANQQMTIRSAVAENARRLAASATAAAAQNTAGVPYKPPIAPSAAAAAAVAAAVAAAAGPKLNGNATTTTTTTTKASARSGGGKGSRGGANASAAAAAAAAAATPAAAAAANLFSPENSAALQRLVANGTIKPDQFMLLFQQLQQLQPALGAAFTASTAAKQREAAAAAAAKEQERARRIKAEQDAQAAAQRKAAAEAAAAAIARENAANAQQKIVAARQKFWAAAERQLLDSLPAPKAPIADLSFVPNATQPDFLYLLGLDLVVQRNLKDKNVFK